MSSLCTNPSLARVGVLAVAVFLTFGTFDARGASTCEEVFSRSGASVSNAKTERQRLMELAHRYYATPVADRAGLRDPAYTTIVNALLKDLDATYETTQRNALSRGAWFSKRKLRLRLARAYLELIRQNIQRKTQDGDMTALGAQRIGHHAAWLYDLIDGTVALKDLSTQMIPQRAEEFFSDNARAGTREFLPTLAAIPTMKWYSHEGVIELMAHGMRVYGVYKDRPEGRDARNYRQHDRTHAGDWHEALLPLLEVPYYQPETATTRRLAGLPAEILDLTQSVTYRRIHSRFLKIVERLKTYPQRDRDAAFAFAFYLFHERPELYMKALATRQPLTPAPFFSPTSFFAKRMDDVEDLGLSFPQKMDHGAMIVIDSKGNVERAHKTFLEAIKGL